jgi:hypothetical protein
VRYTPSFCQVKNYLNLVYVATAIRAATAIRSAELENHAIAKARAEKLTRDDDIGAYRDRVWFESHARHSFVESAGRISLCRRSGGISAAPLKSEYHLWTWNSSRKGPKQYSSARFQGTKFGRIESLPTGAPYRRDDAARVPLKPIGPRNTLVLVSRSHGARLTGNRCQIEPAPAPPSVKHMAPPAGASICMALA